MNLEKVNKRVILVGIIFLSGILLGGYIQEKVNHLSEKETVSNINQSLENNCDLSTANFDIVLHEEYRDSEEYASFKNKALLSEFGREGLGIEGFEYEKKEIFGTILYPIHKGHVLCEC